MSDDINYGPLHFLIRTWESKAHLGENRAPDPDRPDRKVENTKFEFLDEKVKKK